MLVASREKPWFSYFSLTLSKQEVSIFCEGGVSLMGSCSAPEGFSWQIEEQACLLIFVIVEENMFELAKKVLLILR